MPTPANDPTTVATQRPRTWLATFVVASSLIGAASLGALSSASAELEGQPSPRQTEAKQAEASHTDASRAIADVASKLQQGEMFRYSIRSRQVRQHQKPDESIIKWIVRRTLTVSCEVIEPDPALGARVRVTIDELNVTLLDPARAVRFTSGNKHANTVGAPMTLAMEPLVGAKLVFTVGHDGAIRSVDGVDQLLKEKELRKYTEHIVGDEAIEELFQPIFRSIAQPADDPGSEPWASERTYDFPGFARIRFDEHWTMARRDAGRVTFSVEGETSADIEEQWPDAVLRNSTSLGSLTWDEMTGRLSHTEINRFYVVDLMNDPDGPSIAGEEVITISAPLGDQ